MTKLTETQREMLTKEEQTWQTAGAAWVSEWMLTSLFCRLADVRKDLEGERFTRHPADDACMATFKQERDEAQKKIEKYELFLCKLRDMTYRAPELFPTNEVATYAHQLGVEADGILCEIDK